MSSMPPHDREIGSIRAGLDACRIAITDLLGAVERAEPRFLDVDSWLTLRAETGEVVRRLFESMREVDAAFAVSDVHDRLQVYFEAHRGEVVRNYELMGVAGTLEWARRVRELVNDVGLPVSRGPGNGLRPGEYRLDSDRDTRQDRSER